jgi:hypothetical protein
MAELKNLDRALADVRLLGVTGIELRRYQNQIAAAYRRLRGESIRRFGVDPSDVIAPKELGFKAPVTQVSTGVAPGKVTRVPPPSKGVQFEVSRDPAVYVQPSTAKPIPAWMRPKRPKAENILRVIDSEKSAIRKQYRALNKKKSSLRSKEREWDRGFVRYKWKQQDKAKAWYEKKLWPWQKLSIKRLPVLDIPYPSYGVETPKISVSEERYKGGTLKKRQLPRG